MNWDWEKLQEKRQRQKSSGGGGKPQGPDLSELGEKLKQFKGFKLPGGKLLIALAIVLWLLSGIYIVDPDEVGVVQRFGAFNRITESGPHYRLPYPIEKVQTPKVTQVRRVEVGFRSPETKSNLSSSKLVPEESLMLTGDENIVNAQFIAQYRIKDPHKYLFNIAQSQKTVRDAAEAAMREVIGYNMIDSALTTGKTEIQNDTKELLQKILNRYGAGIQVTTIQLQDVQPPDPVVDAFKDVASAREDKTKFINEAQAYENDLIPKTRGEVASILNKAHAYKETEIRQARGQSKKFLAVWGAYKESPAVTRKRLYLDTMQEIYSKPGVDKLILSEEAMQGSIPYLPLPGPGQGKAPGLNSAGSK
ncbi:MAG: FtsH protease activity modulator HflK [Desulfonatronovibrionaceae bacterium]